MCTGASWIQAEFQAHKDGV